MATGGKENVNVTASDKTIIQTTPTMEGAGVKLQRAFGFGKTKDFDPFLLLDDFRNDNPAGLSGGISLASAPRASKPSPMCWPAQWNTGTASATGAR